MMIKFKHWYDKNDGEYVRYPLHSRDHWTSIFDRLQAECPDLQEFEAWIKDKYQIRLVRQSQNYMMYTLGVDEGFDGLEMPDEMITIFLLKFPITERLVD